MLQKIPYFSQRVVLITTALILVLDLVLNHYYRDELYRQGINVIYGMQNPPNSTSQLFFNVVSLAVDPVVITVVVCAVFLAASNKFSALLVLIFFLINTFIVGELKALYADPRPYWSNGSIKNLGWYCPADYGNPSGHSWLAPVFYELVIYQFLGAGPYGIYLFVPLILSGLVPISRMYLGAHSLNQVLMGVLNGIGYLVLYRYAVRDIINTWLTHFLNRKMTLNKKIVAYTVGANVICIAIPMLRHLVKADFRMSVDLITNIVSACGTPESRIALLNTSLMMLGSLLNLVFGFVYGLFAIQDSYGYYLGRWEYLSHRPSWMNKLLKFLVDFGLVFGPLILTISIVFPLVENPFIEYIAACMAFLVGGYLYIGHSGRTLQRLSVIEIDKLQPTRNPTD